MKKHSILAAAGWFLLALGTLAFLLWFFLFDRPSHPQVFRSTANGITLTLTDAYTNGDVTRLELCYLLPDQRDWLLTTPFENSNPELTILDRTYTPVEEGTLYWLYNEEGQVNGRCEYLHYRTFTKFMGGMAALKINTLNARQPGQEDYLLAARDVTGLEMGIILIDPVLLDGFDEKMYVKMPVGLMLSNTKMRDIVQKIRWEYHTGPWSFSFPIRQVEARGY